MKNQKASYIMGLVFFIFALVFTASLLTTPDGRPLFYGFLKLFFEKPLQNAVVTNWTYLIFTCAVIFAIFTVLFWRKSVSHYKELIKAQFAIPISFAFVLMIISIFPIVDLIYFSGLSRKDGIQAVSVELHDYTLLMSANPDEHDSVFTDVTYDFTFHNHGNSDVAFTVKPCGVFSYGSYGFRLSPYIAPSRLYGIMNVLYDDGETRSTEDIVFTVEAGQEARFSGEMNLVLINRAMPYQDREDMLTDYDYVFLELTCANTGVTHEIMPLAR